MNSRSEEGCEWVFDGRRSRAIPKKLKGRGHISSDHMSSADYWNTFGIDHPNRADYQCRAAAHLNSLDRVLPKELCLIIAEYGSTLIPDELYFGYGFVTFDQIHPSRHIPNCDENALGARVASIILNGIYFDLLDNGIWKLRMYYGLNPSSSLRYYVPHSEAMGYISQGWRVISYHSTCHLNITKLKFDESIF